MKINNITFSDRQSVDDMDIHTDIYDFYKTLIKSLLVKSFSKEAIFTVIRLNFKTDLVFVKSNVFTQDNVYKYNMDNIDISVDGVSENSIIFEVSLRKNKNNLKKLNYYNKFDTDYTKKYTDYSADPLVEMYKYDKLYQSNEQYIEYRYEVVFYLPIILADIRKAKIDSVINE